MIKLLNPSGGNTWVDEARFDEYKRRGFKAAPPPSPEPAAEPEPKPKKTTKPTKPKKPKEVKPVGNTD